MKLRILLVEDDRELTQVFRSALLVEGHEVLTAAGVLEAQRILQHQDSQKPLDCVLLDLGLPDGDGQTLLERLRRFHSLPVIVVSARPEDESKIRLLDAGADDYLVKPFGVGELMARIRVAMRHRGKTATPALWVYQRDGLTIDLTKREVRLHGQEVKLTPTEYELLARLVRSAGQALSHRQLLQDVWGPEYVEHSQYTRLYVAQLRAKLEVNAADPHFILTETGVGYRLLAHGEESL